MKVKKLRIAHAVVIAMSLFTGHYASALYTTTNTELPKNGSLIITAYKAVVTDTTPAATASNKLYRIDTVDLVQVYNSGSAPLNVAEWRVVDTFNPNRELQFNRLERSGWLEPGKHVVLATMQSVPDATYRLDGWSSAVANPVKIPGVSLVHSSYRASQIDVTGSNVLRKRVFGSTSYNSTFQDAVMASDVTDTTATATLFDDGLYALPTPPVGLKIIEIYPYASECPPFDSSILCSDYVKLANDSQQNLELDGYVLRTDSSSSSRTTGNTIMLAGTLAPGEVVPVHLTDSGSKLSLTNGGGYVWLEDTWGFARYEGTMKRYESAGASLQGYAYALAANGEWAWTSTPQPTGDNVITPPEVATCPDGKYRNPDTGRCRTLEETINALAACEEGYERNPTTNRCRKVASASVGTLTPCKEGQERNLATNRCRSIASAVAELLPCDEGYERNPATNRCRKIRDTSVLGAKYPVQPYDQGTNAMATWWVIGGIAALALGYAGWEWRREITTGLGRLRSVFTSGK